MIRIDFNKSSGSFVFDKNTGKSYLDLFNHYASLPLGYNHPVFSSPGFIENVIRVSRIKNANGKYSADEAYDFVQDFGKHVGTYLLRYRLFCCTGSLAVETAVKILWAKSTVKDILVLGNNFHGVNALGNFLSNGISIEDRLKQNPWWVGSPFWKVQADKEKIIEALQARTYCGIVIEPIQCTAGDIHLGTEFLNDICAIAREFDVPVVFDEIQTGFGATGKWWYYHHLNIIPDIVIFGKKAQVSGVMASEKFQSAIIANWPNFSVTFDGDLIDMIRSRYIINAIVEDNLLENITHMGEKICETLGRYQLYGIGNVRGTGGIIAFDLYDEALRDQVREQLFQNRILCNPTGEKTIRLRPALNFNDNDLDFFDKALSKINL